jgi:predicted PurR-regulated permease PerM
MTDELADFLNADVSFVPYLEQGELYNRISEWVSKSSVSIMQQSFSGTTIFLAGLLATTIFTFLLLIYRDGLTHACTSFASENKSERILKMLKSVQQVGQQYLSGMLIVVTIIGFANSIGLWIIGVDNPFLFGFLGALLSIIPYVGTTTGGIIPVLYAIIFHDSLWMALSIAILFWAVQLISDNFLSPKIIGGSMRINALAAILSLIVGAAVWGIAGMILFLPFTAMLKVVCDEYNELKPVALLIEDQNHHGKARNFLGKWIAALKNRLSK